MIPMIYTAGRDCDTAYEGLAALYAAHPDLMVSLSFLALLVIAFAIYVVYRTFVSPVI